MSRVARFAIRRPILVIVTWAVLVLVLGLIGRGVEDKVLPTELLVPGTEADRWKEVRAGHFGEDAAVLLRGPKEEIDRQGPRLARDLALRPGTRALSPWSAGKGARQLRPSPDRALITLDLEVPPGETQSTIVPPLERFVDERVSPPLESHLAGEAPLGKDINEATTEGAHKAELLAAPILIIVLLLVFRSPIAAAIPLMMGQGTVFASFGVISLILERTDLDAISLSIASGIGLALGVDYSLLIITRFRESLDDGLAPKQAASLAANTAGRTAMFAGCLLVAIMAVSFFLSPGQRAAVVRRRRDRGHHAEHGRRRAGHPGRGHAGRAATSTAGSSAAGAQSRSLLGGVVGRVTRRPALAAGLVLALLMLVAAPVSALEMIPPDPRQLPKDSKGLDDYNEVRAAGFGPTVEVALRAPEGAVMDPRRVKQIAPFEKRLGRVRYVSSAFGPQTLADQTKALARRAPVDQARPPAAQEGRGGSDPAGARARRCDRGRGPAARRVAGRRLRRAPAGVGLRPRAGGFGPARRRQPARLRGLRGPGRRNAPGATRLGSSWPPATAS